MGYGSGRGGSPPAWFVFLLGIAFVFGGAYLWANLQTFLQSGGVSVSEATAISQVQSTSTAVRQVTNIAELPTRRPTATPKPACQDFAIRAGSAIIRQGASTSSRLLDSVTEGTVVCVLDSIEGSDGFIWYYIDRDAVTNFIEPGYVREDVVRPLNPTPTPSNTPLPPPTITITYTPTASSTPLPADDDA